MTQYFIDYGDLRKYLLLTHAFLFYGGVIFLRSFVLYRKTGKNPLVGFFKPRKMSLGEEIFRLSSVGMGLISCLFLFWPMSGLPFTPWTFGKTHLLLALAILIGIIGFAMVFMAQWQMGNSWRISIDKDDQIDFVTKGLFKYSRNPIYVGLVFCFLSYFLIIPSILTLCLFIFMTVGIYKKVMDEESHLLSTYGAKYTSYTSSVRRWL